VAASSYYTLTPASSTASLNDFALLNSTLTHQHIAATNSRKTNASAKAQTAAASSGGAATAVAGGAAASANVPRRRGRPPKNATGTQR